jgi:hypothetical protein
MILWRLRKPSDMIWDFTSLGALYKDDLSPFLIRLSYNSFVQPYRGRPRDQANMLSFRIFSNMSHITCFQQRLKGNVQRKLRWVENGVNRNIRASDCGAGHSFVVLFGFHLGFAIFPFPVSILKLWASSGSIGEAVRAT